jgi:hypothetical protein
MHKRQSSPTNRSAREESEVTRILVMIRIGWPMMAEKSWNQLFRGARLKKWSTHRKQNIAGGEASRPGLHLVASPARPGSL